MPFSFNAYSSLLLPACFQGVLFTSLLLIRFWRDGETSDWLLALLLLLNTLSVAQWMLGFAGWYDSHDAYSTFMFYFPFNGWLAFGPVLYFYFLSLTNRAFQFQRRELWHFIPALVYLLWHAIAFAYDILLHYQLGGKPLPFHFGTHGPLAVFSNPLNNAVEIIGYGSVMLYTYLTINKFIQYRTYLNAHFSDTTNIRFTWLRNLLFAILLSLAIAGLFGIVNLSFTRITFSQYWYSYLITGLVIYYLSIAGYMAGRQLPAALHFSPPIPSETTPATQSEAPAIDLAVWQEKVRKAMETEQLYLDPELTLGKLASHLKTNPSLLSRVVNTSFGQNFNDFVNGYRVDLVEQRLRNDKYHHYTLIAIALDSGFNSKATFNRVFKKLKGITPKQYTERIKS